MGAKEYARFLAVCTACIGAAAFVSMLFLYYGQRDEKILYEPICGFQGLVASLLVASIAAGASEDKTSRTPVQRLDWYGPPLGKPMQRVPWILAFPG